MKKWRISFLVTFAIDSGLIFIDLILLIGIIINSLCSNNCDNMVKFMMGISIFTFFLSCSLRMLYEKAMEEKKHEEDINK